MVETVHIAGFGCVLHGQKRKNFFAQPKNLPQIYMAKIGTQKSRFKICGGRFLSKILRKFYENFTPTAYSLRVSIAGGRSGMPCAALPGVDRKTTKPFEMAACSSCNVLRVVDIGRFCKACTARFWANLHSMTGAAWIRCGVLASCHTGPRCIDWLQVPPPAPP